LPPENIFIITFSAKLFSVSRLQIVLDRTGQVNLNGMNI